jgi:hypothetical protein
VRERKTSTPLAAKPSESIDTDAEGGGDGQRESQRSWILVNAGSEEEEVEEEEEGEVGGVMTVRRTSRSDSSMYWTLLCVRRTGGEVPSRERMWEVLRERERDEYGFDVSKEGGKDEQRFGISVFGKNGGRGHRELGIDRAVRSPPERERSHQSCEQKRKRRETTQITYAVGTIISTKFSFTTLTLVFLTFTFLTISPSSSSPNPNAYSSASG